MPVERVKEHLEQWGALLLVAFAVAWGISYRGFSGETMADALKDVGSALVPIFAALFAARLIRRDLPPEQRYLAEGERALRAVQKKYDKFLQGPKYDRAGYDPEAGGKGDRYLFVQALPKKARASLVPLSPLSEGVVAITVSKKNLVILERARTSEGEARTAVRKAVVELLKQKPFMGHFEILESKNRRAAIVVDFDEGSMGIRGFRRAVEAVIDRAVQTLLELPVGPEATPASGDGGTDA